MKKAKVGQAVTWTIDRKRNPIRLIGHVEAVDGEWATVRTNGTTHTVHLHTMRSAYKCVVCGELTQRGTEFYCSLKCYGIDQAAGTDDAVFEAIIKYKTENDGCTPNLAELTRLSKFSESAVVRSIRRMIAAGRIQQLGGTQSWRIVIPGAKWTYEP